MAKKAETGAFPRAYNRLNPEQKKAVDTIEGPVMVIAGPGTGKTTVLTLRIANILRQTDTPPDGVLAITYTDAGAGAMRAKLRDIIGASAHDVGIYTFHGFAAAMIAAYPDHFLEIADRRVMTDIEQEALVRALLSEPAYADLRPSGRPDAYLSAILRTIDAAKREAWTPEAVRAHARDEAERIRADASAISTRGATKGKLKAEAEERIKKCERTLVFADVYAAYEAEKRAAKLMDYNDLIVELLNTLQDDELFRRLVQERFLYVLVDEHQDTNNAQNLIIRLIGEFFETPNIFIVGDEKQAIYRFQGASVENFLSLQRHWPAIQAMSLNVNYRSHQDILDASFGMIEHNYTDDEHQDLRVKLSAEREQGRRPVDIVNGENTPAIEEYLVREVSAIIQAHPDASIAVIMRRNRELERVLRVFELAGVPVSSERSIDIFAHPVGAVFFDLLAYLADPTRIDALARTMISGLWNLTLDDAAAFVRDLKSGRAADLERRLPALRTIRNRMMHDGAIGFLVAAASESGFERLVVRHPAHTAVWRGIVALAESLARERHIEHPAALIEALLAYRTSAETKTVKVSVGAPESTVRAMTAHGSKGLEFDYVFVPYATEEAWVGRARGRSFVLPDEQSSGDDIRDARRLLYVALTRARKHAVILTAREESDGRTLTPLRFLEELDPDSVASVDIPRVHTAPLASPRAESGDDASVRALTDMAKQRLCASGLSVTALNHFIESPEKFLIESVLRVPQAPSVSAEKGSAMHAAMDRVWKTAQKTPKTIEKTIRTVVSEYLADSFLPIRDKETIEREVSDTAPVVAAALEAHVTTTGTVYTEYWVESAFAGSFDGNAVRFPLHGKLDAIIEEGDDVFVFDYKTTKSMSTAAIKGETKSSDGKYFRQLIFYALLMHEHPRWKGKRIHTSLVFLSPDKKGRCPTVTVPVTKEDIEGLRSDIQALIDYVWSGQLETALPDFPENG